MRGPAAAQGGRVVASKQIAGGLSWRRVVGLIAAASVAVLVASTLDTTPAAASAPTALYAYAGGGANPTGCPVESTPSNGCSLAQALAQAAAGDDVLLAGDATYVGNWTVATTGTSSTSPVTIEPAAGASPV